MKALLDTQTLLWWLDGDNRLSELARHWIADSAHIVFVSVASAWEIATMVRIGKSRLHEEPIVQEFWGWDRLNFAVRL